MKKLILLGMAVAAVAAFAMPAAASALEMRDEAGKVALNAEITGVSTNTKTTNTALGNLFCSKVDVNGKITVNGPSEITGVGTAAEATTCEASGKSLTVTKPTLVHLVTKGGDKAEAKLSFIADVGPFECTYEGTVPGTYETGTGKDNLVLLGTISSPAEICRAEEGVTTFEGTFTLTTKANGEPVWIQ